MTDAPPLNGGDPTAILEWLVAQVAELREENGRMKTLLALHGADPEAAADLMNRCQEMIYLEASARYSAEGVLRQQIAQLQAQVAVL